MLHRWSTSRYRLPPALHDACRWCAGGDHLPLPDAEPLPRLTALKAAGVSLYGLSAPILAARSPSIVFPGAGAARLNERGDEAWTG